MSHFVFDQTDLPGNKRNKRAVVTPLYEVSAEEFNVAMQASRDLRQSILLGEGKHAKYFGIKLDGTTDDTRGWTDALEAVYAGDTDLIRIPPGVSLVTTPLTARGSPTKGAAFLGLSAALHTGVRIKYVGDPTNEALWTSRGLTNSVFSNIYFDANQLAGFGHLLASDQVNGGGCFYNRFYNCMFGNSPTGADKAPLGLGEPGIAYQVSELDFYSCHFLGAFGVSTQSVLQRNNGNCKNFRFMGGSCAYSEIGFNFALSSGSYMLHGIFIGGTSDNAIKTGPNGFFSIHAVEVETFGRFLTGSAGANSAAYDISACDVNVQTDVDDVVISVGGALSLTGNSFRNDRTGSSEPRIACAAQASPGTAGPGSIHSVGNFFQFASDVAPFYDQSGNKLLGSDFSAQVEHQVNSLFDYGGVAGALGRLRNVGPFVDTDILSSRQHAKAPVYTGRPTRSASRYNYTFSDFQVAALTKDFVLCQPRDGERVCAVYLSYSGFTGTAGTLKFRVGSTVGGQEFLLDTLDAVSQTVDRYGRLPASLGSALTTDASQGGYVSSGAYNPRIRLTSSSGNLSGLSAGTVSVWVITEQLP